MFGDQNGALRQLHGTLRHPQDQLEHALADVGQIRRTLSQQRFTQAFEESGGGHCGGVPGKGSALAFGQQAMGLLKQGRVFEQFLVSAEDLRVELASGSNWMFPDGHARVEQGELVLDGRQSNPRAFYTPQEWTDVSLKASFLVESAETGVLACGFIVREGGVEPPLHHWNTDLNRARLPIPPLARTQKE